MTYNSALSTHYSALWQAYAALAHERDVLRHQTDEPLVGQVELRRRLEQLAGHAARAATKSSAT